MPPPLHSQLRAFSLRSPAALACTLALCTACDLWSGEAKLREAGPTPYVRCVAGQPPEPRTGRLGAVEFSLNERTLTLKKGSGTLRLAAFAGASFTGLDPAAVESLRRSDADAFVLVGGLGDTAALAGATAKALAGLHRLVIVVLGGRDSWRFSRDALDESGAPAAIIDASTLRQVRIDSTTLVPWSGAELGRYAMDDARCGFGAADLETATRELGRAAAAERRWLLSWQAPSSSDGANDLGSVSLGKFASAIGAGGAIYAWPVEAPAEASDAFARVAVPRVSGPPVELPDGSPAPGGFVLLDADSNGVRLVSPAAPVR